MTNLGVLAEYRQRVPGPGLRQRDAGHPAGVPRVAGAARGGLRDAGRELVGGLLRSQEGGDAGRGVSPPRGPHDCTGPVVLVASLHLALNAPNAIFQEVVRAYYAGWYRDLVTELPRIEGGYAHAMRGPGLGTSLAPGLRRRLGVTVQRSGLP